MYLLIYINTKIQKIRQQAISLVIRRIYLLIFIYVFSYLVIYIFT